MQSMPNIHSRLDLALRPGEVLWALPGTLASLEADMDVRTRLFPGPIRASARRLLSLSPARMVEIRNRTESDRHILLTPPVPGDIGCVNIDSEQICLNTEALLAFTGKIRFRTHWVGATYARARRRCTMVYAQGSGRIWFFAFGALMEKTLAGQLQADPSHVLAYEAGICIKRADFKSIIAGIARGNGPTPTLAGNGRLFLQTRSLHSLTDRLNHKH